MKMKRIASSASLALALGLMAGIQVAAAQSETVTTSKTTTYSGVVSELNPATSTIVLTSESSPAPVTYTYTKETTFVDANGNVVTSEMIRNSPVRIEYSTEGGRTVVRKVTQTQTAVVVSPPAVVVPAPVVIVPAPAPTIHEKTTTRTETEKH